MAKKKAAEEASTPARAGKEAGQAQQKSARPARTEAARDSRPNPVTRFIRYVEASRAELRKVTWPSLKETRKATIAVLVFVGIMAILLGLIDLGLSSLIKAVLS